MLTTTPTLKCKSLCRVISETKEPGAEVTMHLAQVPTEMIEIAPWCPSTNSASEIAVPARPASV